MRYISATHLFDGRQFLNDHSVLVLDHQNRFVELVNENMIDRNAIEYYEGIVCPGFVNAHCHLELSHMLGVIPDKRGFLNFGKEIMTKRNSFSEEEIQEAIAKADKKMVEEGIVAVGDISNTKDTFKIKSTSSIYYTTFIELIALNPERVDVVFNAGKELQSVASGFGLESSLVPHAPYSVSPELMRRIADEAGLKKTTVSIHNQESAAENLFFQRKEGDFIEFYNFLNIPIDYFKPSGRTSLLTYLQDLVSSERLILVHNTFTTFGELKKANSILTKPYWCTCPNANLYIENRLPDLKNFIDTNCCMVIGTDSLASNNSLSMVNEMNVLMNNFKWLKIADLLKWATYNGAEALGVSENYGGFIKGKNAGLNHLNYKQNHLEMIQKLA